MEEQQGTSDFIGEMRKNGILIKEKVNTEEGEKKKNNKNVWKSHEESDY